MDDTNGSVDLLSTNTLKKEDLDTRSDVEYQDKQQEKELLDAVKINQKMEPGTGLAVSLEEALLPVHVLELHISLGWWHIHKLALVVQDDAIDSLRVPKKLVTIVIANDVLVVTLTSNVYTIRDFVTLISQVLVERGDDIVKEGELLNRLNESLACRGIEIIIGTLEDKTQALWHEANLVGFAPAEKVQSNLSDSIMLGHLVHACLPTILSSLEAFVTFEIL
ncbi:hypothetical protein HG531_005024 [Fusarium graminearum]|nr:hypothetical protein HG531_005024 [Fusarium graminearum]